MQPRPLLIAIALSLAVAGAASGQAKTRRPPPPAPREEPEIVRPAKAAAPQTPTSLRTGGLPSVGDAAPACRAQCSKDRYVCHAAGDPTDCDSRWIPCLQTCSSR